MIFDAFVILVVDFVAQGLLNFTHTGIKHVPKFEEMLLNLQLLNQLRCFVVSVAEATLGHHRIFGVLQWAVCLRVFLFDVAICICIIGDE